MADVDRGERPLSPHLTIYRRQSQMVMSILHRITGVGMTLAAVLIVWWLLAAATGPDYFALADDVLTSWLGLLILFGSTWALAFHLCNGIRHLFWDAGEGFELDQVDLSGKVVAGASVLLTLFVWLALV